MLCHDDTIEPYYAACYVFCFDLQMLYTRYRGNKLLNLLGTWNVSSHS
jgi:hypothetical protein